MYIPKYPEDSTLRRHFESAAGFRRQVRLAQPPTDSVLRRHYEQLQRIGAGAATSVSPTPEPPRHASQPPGPGPAAESGGGLFGWLKRLFS